MQSYIYGCTYIIFILESLSNVQNMLVMCTYIYFEYTYSCRVHKFICMCNCTIALTYKYNKVFIFLYIN